MKLIKLKIKLDKDNDWSSALSSFYKKNNNINRNKF